MITAATLKKSLFRATMFADMAKGGYLQCYVNADFPRLTIEVSAKTRSGPVERRFFVDGKEMADIDAAAAALNQQVTP